MKFINIKGSLRVRHVEETIKEAVKVFKKVGITRLADISTLSRPGGSIHTMSAIRPNAYIQQMSNGKGITKLNSTASAIMETIELMHSETMKGLQYEITSAKKIIELGKLAYTLEELLPNNTSGSMLDLSEANMPYLNATEFKLDENLKLQKEGCYIPAAACIFQVFPYTNRSISTNGLSSGNTREEAMIHGLLELIERDAISKAKEVRRVKIKESNKSKQLRYLEQADLEYEINYYEHETHIPTIGCVIYDKKATARINAITEGWGCHKNKEIALSRAVTEAVQGKTVSTQGAREDIDEIRQLLNEDEIYMISKIIQEERQKNKLRNSINYEDINNLEVEEEDSEELYSLIRTVLTETNQKVLCIDLSRPDIGISVTKCIVPGFGRKNER